MSEMVNVYNKDSQTGRKDAAELSEKKEGYKTPLTLEVIKSDPRVLKIIYNQLTIEKQRSPFQYDTELLDFGPDYEKATLSAIGFYIAYETGLFAGVRTAGNKIDDVEEYLMLLYSDPASAESFIEVHTKEPFVDDYADNTEFLSQGRDLSTILPGAPSIITENIKYKNRQLDADRPRLSDQSTPKVYDILEQKEELVDIFRGNTVIDFGAGEYAWGLTTCDNLEASQYVGVEPFNAPDLLHDIRQNDLKKELHHIKNLHISYTDIKTFLSKMPEKSLHDVVFLMSGIDEFILGTSVYQTEVEREKGRVYMEDVRKELLRVVSEDCSFVSYASIIWAGELVKSDASKEGDINIFKLAKQ